MNKKENFSIGIIGLGRFGRLLAGISGESFKTVVFSKPKPKNFRAGPRVRFGNLKEVANSPIIIFAVPISSLREAIEEIKPYLKPNTLVVDVCSVKKYPVDLMRKLLPRNIEILATHPLFGPSSFNGELKGSKVVVFPVRLREKRYIQMKKWLSAKGLKVIKVSPRKHDRLMAKTQALTYLIGKILGQMKIDKTPVDTASFQKLLEIKEIVSKDNPQLFKDIFRFNPYAKKMRQEFKNVLQKID